MDVKATLLSMPVTITEGARSAACMLSHEGWLRHLLHHPDGQQYEECRWKPKGNLHEYKCVDLSLKKVRVGCWNGRTMYSTDKTAQVCKEMARYKVEILGISECRWTGSEQVSTKTGKNIIFANRNDRGTHRNISVKYLLFVWMEGCLYHVP